MATAEDVIPGIDLSGDHYVIQQALVRNKYQVQDDAGNVVLKGKQKMFKMKEEFPFTTPDGETVFTVKAEGIFDVAGDYLLSTPDDEPIAVLEKKFTFLKHVWKIRSPEDERLLATIESGSVIVEALRNISTIFNLLPHTYTIEGPNGEQFGTIEGRLSLKDTYDLNIRDSGDIPREALVAACCAIDALEGN